MALYEITLEQEYAGQQCINRWNYISGEIPSGVSGAFKASVGMGFTPDTDIEAFGTETVAGKLQALQYQTVVFVQAIVKNLYDPTDYYTYGFPAGTHGTIGTSQGMSPAMAYGFASDRSRSDVRRAQKRFVGVVEGTIDSEGVISDGFLPVLQELGDTMADVNLVPAGVGSVQFTPYVFGRLKYVAPSGKEAYKYYSTAELQTAHSMLITQFTPKITVRTQTTRQYGHGS